MVQEDFQDVESNYSGRLPHVSSQLVMIPSFRFSLSRDKRIIWRCAKKPWSSPWIRKDEDYSHKWSNCIDELQQHACAQRLGKKNLEENNLVHKKNYLWIQIRSIHEMGELKGAQELRVDEFPVQMLRESHDTIQLLASQSQSMQEQMNSMNDSGEFHKVEWNHSGRLCYVPSQPMIPSSRSMLSRDKRLPRDTWNTSGLQENVLVNQFSTFVSSQNHHQGIHLCTTQRERQDLFHKRLGQGLHSQDMKSELTAQFQCRHLQEGRRPWVLQSQWNYRRTTWSDSKDSNSRKCNSTHALIHNRFQCGKFDSKHKSRLLLIFHRMLCYGSKKWRWTIQWTR